MSSIKPFIFQQLDAHDAHVADSDAEMALFNKAIMGMHVDSWKEIINYLLLREIA